MIDTVQWIIGKLYAKTLVPNSRDVKVVPFEQFFETDRHTSWLIEVLYAIKRDLLGSPLDPRKIACKK